MHVAADEIRVWSCRNIALVKLGENKPSLSPRSITFYQQAFLGGKEKHCGSPKWKESREMDEGLSGEHKPDELTKPNHCPLKM